MPKITSRKNATIPRISNLTKPKVSKLLESYEKLGIKKEDVDNVPKITPILKELPGKVDKAIEYLRGSHDPDARKWLSVYDSLAGTVRKLLPFEAFCVASGLSTKRVLEIITGACFEQNDAVANLLSKAAKPIILQRSIKLASKPKQWEDRKMILQHEGYAPVPKTQILNVGGDINANSDNRVQSININELNGIESTMARITDRFNERLGIGDGSGGRHEETAAIGSMDTPSEPLRLAPGEEANEIIDNAIDIGPDSIDGGIRTDNSGGDNSNEIDWEID